MNGLNDSFSFFPGDTTEPLESQEILTRCSGSPCNPSTLLQERGPDPDPKRGFLDLTQERIQGESFFTLKDGLLYFTSLFCVFTFFPSGKSFQSSLAFILYV